MKIAIAGTGYVGIALGTMIAVDNELKPYEKKVYTRDIYSRD